MHGRCLHRPWTVVGMLARVLAWAWAVTGLPACVLAWALADTHACTILAASVHRGLSQHFSKHKASLGDELQA